MVAKFAYMQRKYEEYKAGREDQLAQMQRAHEEELQRVRAGHASQLSAIDEKVRAALSSKDEMIGQLRAHISELEQKSKGSESVLRGLYSEISSLRR